MKFTTGLAFVAGLVATARAGVIAPTEGELALDKRQQIYGSGGDSGCVSGVHVIAVGGEYTGYGNLSLLDPLAQSVLSSIPNSNMYVVGYPPNAIGGAAIAAAIPVFSSHFTSYTSSCPNTKIVTLGYSTGGATVMDSFCGAAQDGAGRMTNAYRSNIIANIIYGDLTYNINQREAAGTCVPGASGAVGGLVIRAKPGYCYPYGRKTKSYCDIGDPQCCGAGVGNPEIHFTYPTTYDADALKFVMAKWHYYNKNVKGKSSS